ncbi:MAG: Hsp20/alpha crystallin family protein [Parcubacteria group bacterium]|nr:Hsp20/alpha crystallin family protein [Parcubacteria group bacterium]
MLWARITGANDEWFIAVEEADQSFSMNKIIGQPRVEEDEKESKDARTTKTEKKSEQKKTVEKIVEKKQAEEKSWQIDEEGELAVDLYETESDIFLYSAMAGVNEKDLDITVEDDVATIRGKRHIDREYEATHSYLNECFWGSFSRTLILPQPVIPEQTKAYLKNGILCMRMPKKNYREKATIRPENREE